MTRQAAIEGLKALLDCNYIGSLSGEDIESLENAVETMRKYQKIEQIIEVWHQDIYAKDFECIAEVAEVIEDGSN